MTNDDTYRSLHIVSGRGHGKTAALESILREREQELLELKGHCSNKRCSLHYAHRGPCDE